MGLSQQAHALGTRGRHMARDGGTPGGPRVRWTPRVEWVGEAPERYEGPTMDEPMHGQTWCLTKIAELRGWADAQLGRNSAAERLRLVIRCPDRQLCEGTSYELI